MRSANVYQLRDRYFVYPLRKTTAGVWLASAEFVSMPLSALDNDLGAAVLAALQQSDGVVPHPTSWTEVANSRLRAAGAKSEKTFMTNARLVAIKSTDLIELEPHMNGGAKGPQKGFSPVPGCSSTLPTNASSEELGVAIRKSLGACGSEL
ncbi:hypothetical protein [Rhodoferax sp.]|uniref:hypothetical protein n=1 Tax=Rhodoferax sp. TaxID=50421 RepID=UPI002ACE359B|nr:hypothetical protein [Rhodoferax sp.]MDZ7919290.1 hypothetical protein [Rhodoferax sp.]